MSLNEDHGAEDDNIQYGPLENYETKLIVNYIPQYSTEDDIAPIFKEVGNVKSIKIMKDYRTGCSYGFGFVNYFTPEEATRAIEAIDGMPFGTKRLKVSYSKLPSTNMKESNLYVTNLPRTFVEDDVDKLFGQYGKIIQRTVLRNKRTGSPKGVAFIRFSNGEQAQNALNKLHGKLLDDAVYPLNVRIAEGYNRYKDKNSNPLTYTAAALPIGVMIPINYGMVGLVNAPIPNLYVDGFGNLINFVPVNAISSNASAF